MGLGGSGPGNEEFEVDSVTGVLGRGCTGPSVVNISDFSVRVFLNSSVQIPGSNKKRNDVIRKLTVSWRK